MTTPDPAKIATRVATEVMVFMNTRIKELEKEIAALLPCAKLYADKTEHCWSYGSGDDCSKHGVTGKNACMPCYSKKVLKRHRERVRRWARKKKGGKS